MGQEEGRRDRFFLNSPLPCACIVFSRFIVFFPFSCENIEVKIRKSRLKPAEQRSNNPQSEGKGLATLGWSSTSRSLDGARTLLLLCHNDRDSAACIYVAILHLPAVFHQPQQLADQSRSICKSRPRYRAV